MRIYSKLGLLAGFVAADFPAPDGELREGPELHHAVAEHHQRGHQQLVQVPATQAVNWVFCAVAQLILLESRYHGFPFPVETTRLNYWFSIV